MEEIGQYSPFCNTRFLRLPTTTKGQPKWLMVQSIPSLLKRVKVFRKERYKRETTRESAQNIGSALKSIISRYGEMTADPTKLVDSEGEAMSLNRVDKALKSVGITLQDANGQFRNFDEVILELSSKWDTIDKNTQRYLKVA